MVGAVRIRDGTAAQRADLEAPQHSSSDVWQRVHGHPRAGWLAGITAAEASAPVRMSSAGSKSWTTTASPGSRPTSIYSPFDGECGPAGPVTAAEAEDRLPCAIVALSQRADHPGDGSNLPGLRSRIGLCLMVSLINEIVTCQPTSSA
jgi:hypothetical protein